MASDWPATYRVTGIPIAATDTNEAAALCARVASRHQPLEVHLCNTYTLALAAQQPKLRDALLEADLNLPDGVPIACLAKGLSGRSPVRGVDLFRATVAKGSAYGVRHYLYGGTDGSASKVQQALLQIAPRAQIVGVEEPPFRDLQANELEELEERIRESDADIVWVGLGTPRQDMLAQRLARAAGVVVVPVGAAFDFLSGRVKEAPVQLQGRGAEWMYRLAQEPRRLWRRYLVGSAVFASAVLKDKLVSRRR